MVDVQNLVGFFFLLSTSLIDGKIYAQDAYLRNHLTVEFDSSQSKPQTVLQKYKNINLIPKKQKIGKANLLLKHKLGLLRDGEVKEFNPGNSAFPFSIWDINQKVIFPSKELANRSVLIHVFDPDSGFLECMWNSDEALKPLANNELKNTHFIFIPKRATVNETYGALWMKSRILSVLETNVEEIRANRSISVVMEQMHFSVEPVSKLGNLIPSVLQQWECVDHLCGLDQAVIQLEGQTFPVVLKRLDARYDWLPSPSSVFTNNTKPLTLAGNGCQISSSVNKTIAIVTSDGCSYFQKVSAMEKSGAIGVLVVATKGQAVQNMNCVGTECLTQLSIPSTFVEFSDIFQKGGRMNVTFQNTPTSNFFMAIDRTGNLAEVGWFLYPSMEFLIWQAQWFDYQESLNRSLLASEMVVEVFKDKVMQGKDGVVVNITLPDLKDLQSFSKMEIDMSLSCPGTKDTTCGHWDHTVNLYVCCDPKSPLCGMELGRWITSFRRRIGRWLTDVSPLLPLFASNTCTFTMKTAPWAMPWIPSLNLRFSKPRTMEDPHPTVITPLFFPGATFDKNYNSHFKPVSFTVPSKVTKVELFSVITGHGSDENGCGEFCVTSHHLKVNGVENNITFSTAGTPLGCADLVLTGVEPNEHGTWLYGRNGWCDGRNVFPWVVDVTQQVKHSGFNNTVQYFGYFNGTDPNPKQNPGIIYIYSYLVFYEKPL